MEAGDFLALLDSMNLENVSEQEFHDTAEQAKAMTNLSNEERLTLYALFKQSTVGNVNTSRPWSINMVEAAKWDSWKKYEGWPTDKARIAYVYTVKNGFVNQDKSGNVEGSTLGSSVSTLKDAEDDSSPWSEYETIFKLIALNNHGDITAYISSHLNDVNIKNNEGISPILYASDRGLLKTIEILIEFGADINSTDNDGYTPVMYAVINENETILRYLIARGADLNIKNNEGQTILQLNDISPAIKKILEIGSP